jgi:hypothetical protein
MIDFSFNEYTVKKKIEYKNSPSLPLEKHVHKVRRREKLAAYKLRSDDEIKYCLNCSASNMCIEENKLTTCIKYKFNLCSVCGDLAIHAKADNGCNLWNAKRENFEEGIEEIAYCTGCLEIRDSDELEYKASELAVEEICEVEVEVLSRSIDKGVIDEHHLQYPDDHGREITIPLCKECHIKERKGQIPEISPESIGENEHLFV